jgi:hypothetical protein
VRITDDGRRCVVFFGELADNKFVYRGTGFLVASPDGDRPFAYLVTCRHVATNLDAGFHLRANTRDGNSDTQAVHDIDWAYPDDVTVDLAVALLALDTKKWDVAYLNLETFSIPQSGDPYLGGLACGDPISIVGLFRLRQGNERNMPIVHSGNLAALADVREKIGIRDAKTDRYFDAIAHLIEAQTLDGLSGSPVFVHRWAQLPFSGPQGENLASPGSPALLGVYQGSWSVTPGNILAEDKGLTGEVRVPVGMGVVVPIEELQALISGHPKLKKARGHAIG